MVSLELVLALTLVQQLLWQLFPLCHTLPMSFTITSFVAVL
jgi:hypothetical protein